MYVCICVYKARDININKTQAHVMSRREISVFYTGIVFKPHLCQSNSNIHRELNFTTSKMAAFTEMFFLSSYKYAISSIMIIWRPCFITASINICLTSFDFEWLLYSLWTASQWYVNSICDVTIGNSLGGYVAEIPMGHVLSFYDIYSDLEDSVFVTRWKIYDNDTMKSGVWTIRSCIYAYDSRFIVFHRSKISVNCILV